MKLFAHFKEKLLILRAICVTKFQKLSLKSCTIWKPSDSGLIVFTIYCKNYQVDHFQGSYLKRIKRKTLEVLHSRLALSGIHDKNQDRTLYVVPVGRWGDSQWQIPRPRTSIYKSKNIDTERESKPRPPVLKPPTHPCTSTLDARVL